MLSIRVLILGAASALGLSGPLVQAAAAASAPDCEPAALNASALEAGSVTVSPLPGSRDATPQTQISFLGVAPGSLSAISVVGSRSGSHSGRLLAYSQGDGASFVPARRFSQGERVTVHATLRAAGATRRLGDVFAIADQDSISSTPETIHPGSASQVQSFHSRPDLRPPVVTVTVRSPAAAAGDVFLAPYTGPGQAGPMILDPSGAVVWFQPLPRNVSAADFRVQEYQGRPVLTWWQGDVSVHGFGIGNDVILDSSYRPVAVVHAGNGLQADLHEFQLTPAGSALITAYDPILCNLSSVGGPAFGAVTDGVVQEVDVRTGLVRKQWTSLDHVALADSYTPVSGETAFPFDFFHVNSINLDGDGSLLVSARNTWTVYDVDGRTGRIDWRLGGKHSTFAEGPGVRTAWQHDPRPLSGGAISIFDNGSSPTVHSQSRGEVVQLDPTKRTATLVGQLLHPPPIVAESQGNLQLLENGNWFVGWGQYPELSEFGPQGTLVFDARLPPHSQSYRGFRLAWSGMPAHPPTFALAAAPAGAATVYASWNGASLVASWRVLAGPNPASLSAVAEAPRSGFETAIALPAGTAGPDVAVQALDASGQSLGVSPAAAETALPGG
jgi:hypothetical protein